MEERIQKLFSGFCSRRKAEEYLSAGRVSVNGQTAFPGQKADPARDVILLDGKPIPKREKPVYIMLNKPRGYVTTLSDERGRRTVAGLVRECGKRVYPAGRLDMDSEGLLIMTNDGSLTRRLTHPAAEIEKTYEVTVCGAGIHAAEELSAVRSLDGERIRPARVELLHRIKPADGVWKSVLRVTVHEGKNRQIRRMCEQCGWQVERLRRVREHTLELGTLKPGKWRYLRPEEVAALRGDHAYHSAHGNQNAHGNHKNQNDHSGHGNRPE